MADSHTASAEKKRDYPFEQFPRGEIEVATPRRRFLSAIMAEVHVYNTKTSGHVGKKLSDLGSRTDEDLFCVSPVITSGSKIEQKDGYLRGTAPGGRAIILFQTTSTAMTVFSLFDGVNTLVEIADTLSTQTRWNEEKSFAYTRGVFLSLVTIGLCHPKW
jgi:hypothetical protein